MTSTTFYTAGINLNIGQVPNNIQDPAVYQALLDIHNALEVLAQEGYTSDDTFNTFASKYFAATVVSGEDYVMSSSDVYTILVLTGDDDVTITLPPTDDVSGRHYTIKHVSGDGTVIVKGEGDSTIDDSTYELDISDAISVQCVGSDWYVY